MNDHLNNDSKDGNGTNQIKSKILDSKPIPYSTLYKFYHEYCESLGIEAYEKGIYGTERKILRC